MGGLWAGLPVQGAVDSPDFRPAWLILYGEAIFRTFPVTFALQSIGPWRIYTALLQMHQPLERA